MNKNKLIMDNALIILVSVIFLIISSLVAAPAFYSIMAVAFMILSIYLIFRAYRIEKNLLNFYTCYYAIWLFLIPFTSFSFPLMNSMSPIVWNYCLIGNCCFSLAIIVSLLIKYRRFSSPFLRSFERTNHIENSLYLFILMVSIVVLFLNTIVNGLGVFSGNIKITEPFFGYNILATLGSLAIFMLFRSFKNVSKKFKLFIIIFTAIYLFFQIFSGIRWTVILLILMCSSLMTVDKKRIFYFIVLAIGIVIIFIFANYFRRGADAIEKYYIQTGLYNGSIDAFFSTEIFRYFGMSQRLIEQYVISMNPGYAHGAFTSYSFFKWFVSVQLPDNIWQNGYNALNIIGYLWGDFGAFWPLALFLWSLVIASVYRLYKVNKNNSLIQYLWSIGFMSVALSFFCYMQHYTYWLTLLPLTVLIVHFISSLGNNQYGYLLSSGK